MKIKNIIFALLNLFVAIVLIIAFVNYLNYHETFRQMMKYYDSIGALEVANGEEIPSKMSVTEILFSINLCISAVICIINSLFFLGFFEFIKATMLKKTGVAKS